MGRYSNIVIGILNLFTTVIALAAIGTYIYLHFFNASPTHCQRMLETPLLYVGLALLVVSMLGLIGSCCHVTMLMWIYLTTVVLLIVGWFGFSVFVFLITNKGAGQAVSDVGIGEYRLGHYSNWLQKHVVNGKNWDEIRSCLVDAQVCKNVGGGGFAKNHLSSIQSGCCKPPADCDFAAKNATTTMANPDCKEWSNDEKKLCYECNECKAGVLNAIRKQWRKFAIFNTVVLLLLLLVYAFACCAIRSGPPKFYSGGYP